MAIMKPIKSIFHLSSNISRSCPEEGCGFAIANDALDDAVNHMIEVHGYQVEHIGQETSTGGDGRPYHSTVAVVAKRE